MQYFTRIFELEFKTQLHSRNFYFFQEDVEIKEDIKFNRGPPGCVNVETKEDIKLNHSAPGCVYTKNDKDISLNVGRGRVKINVSSICDRPIQVSFNKESLNFYLLFKKIMSLFKH